MRIANYVASRLVPALMLVPLLAGCSIYGTTRAHYSPGAAVYYSTGPVYALPPAPVYVDPWYAGPPVFLDFGFRSWGDRGQHYDYRGRHDSGRRGGDRWHGGGPRGGDGWHGGGRGNYHGHRGHGGRSYRGR